MKHSKLIQRVLNVRMHSGDEAYCLCPFHEDSNPSFAINERTGLWICHGCGLKGNIEQLTQRLGLDSPTSTLDGIIEKIGELQTPLPDVNQALPEEWLSQFLKDQGYWRGRGLRKRTIDKFGLGHDPITNYATIPVRRHNGDLIGVIRRAVLPDQSPKYVYPKGFPKAQEFFGSWMFRGTKAVLVEGALDAIACWEANSTPLAIYGSSISTHHVSLLRRLGVTEVTILTDDDIAGHRARNDIIESLNGMIIRIPSEWPNGAKDPMDIDRGELYRIIRNAKHLWNIDTLSTE